jgi:hypothetical protein
MAKKGARSFYYAERARAILRKLVGEHRRTFWVVIVGLVLMNWFAAGSRQLVDEGVQRLANQLAEKESVSKVTWVLNKTVDFGPFVVLLVVLWFLATQTPDYKRPKIKAYTRVLPVRALIVFLSPSRNAPDGIEGILNAQPRPSLRDPAFLTSLGRWTWRMPLQAIAHHAGRAGAERHLEQVVVIPSEDRRQPDGSASGGTHKEYPHFRDLVRKLCEGDPTLAKVEIRSLDEIVRKLPFDQRSRRDYSMGVDFEDPQDLEEAVLQAYQGLQRTGIGDSDVLVDVTGGQKPPSIAGAVVALSPGRMIQYISTHDFRVKVYDVTFDD